LIETVARRLLRRLQPLAPFATSGLHVLAYHLVGAGTDSPVDLPAETFERQMEDLAAAGRVVPLGEGLARLREPSAEPGDSPFVVLTFDDAYDNFRTRVWPVLERLELPATLYVPTGFLDGRCRGPLAAAPDHRPLSWSDLRDLAGTGRLTVGSHGDTHRDLPRLAEPRVREELRRSKDILEHRLERPIPDFCYPRALWSRRVEKQVAVYYRSASIAGGRLNRPDRTRALRLSRLPVRRDMPPDLEPVLARTVWPEEWLADRLRSWPR
jgi:peptidoglycan/xylan/chitin deacetylase (PgdA/CDA1 family)